MSCQQKNSLLLEEALKILDTNKKKASTLRSLILKKNSCDKKDLKFQIIQYLGELEYDFQTINELFKELEKSTNTQILPQENTKQKNDSEIKLERSLIILNERLKLVEAELIKTKNENENLKKFFKYQQQFVYNSDFNDNKYNDESKLNTSTRKNKFELNSLINNKSTDNIITENNINSKLNFNYDPYILKLENTKTNFDDKNIPSNFIKPKKAESCNKNNRLSINEIFQDESKFNRIKTNYENNIEDDLLNGSSNSNFYNLIEDVMRKFKESPENSPLIKRNKREIDSKLGNLHLKTPKRYSHIKSNK